MAYIINRFDGTQLTVVDDGILNSTVSIGLVGRNYTGYGEIQNENFVWLLENFASTNPPARALSGQAWYDTSNKTLKVYNGSAWAAIGNANVSELEPIHSSGGLWLKTTTQQLFVSDGTIWRLVGPEGVAGFSVTKMSSVEVKDSAGNKKPVILTQVNGETIGVYTSEDFNLNETTPIVGFDTLVKGLNLKGDAYVSGDVKGNADTATAFETARKINGVLFAGTTDITIKSSTTKILKRGDFIIGGDFDGSVETTWAIDASSDNRIGKIVSRDADGGFSATIITADLFGDVTGNVTALSGTSRFSKIISPTIEGNTFSGNSATATKLEIPAFLNGVAFDGTQSINLPVPAETLVGNTLAINVVNSSLQTLGKLLSLDVEAPGISIGSGNNYRVYVEGFTPTIESNTTNVLKLKLTSGATNTGPTGISFVSAQSASNDGISAPALVPEFQNTSLAIGQRASLGLPSYKWSRSYIDSMNATSLNVSTISAPSGSVVFPQSIGVLGSIGGNVVGNLTGNVTGNLTGSVSGSSSLNVLKTGDTMTGNLAFRDEAEGITWDMNSDGASIKFYNIGDGDNTSRLEFETRDNNNEYFSWAHSPFNAAKYESMRLAPNGNGSAMLTVYGSITTAQNVIAVNFIGNGGGLTGIDAANITGGRVANGRLNGQYDISITGKASTAGSADYATNAGTTNTATNAAIVLNNNRITAEGGTTDAPSGLTVRRVYSNGYPSTYGNLISVGGEGHGQFLIGWSGTSGATAENYIRSQRDTGDANWSTWARLITDQNFSGIVSDYAPTKTGGGASGTWGINITGNAATASSIAWTGVSGKPTNFVFNDTGTYNITALNSGTATNSRGILTRGWETAIGNGVREPASILSFSEVYNNGYPIPYGNLLSLGGIGGGQLLVGWSGSTGAHADNYIRSRRDVDGDIWSAWARLITDVNYTEYAPTKTGGGASGTWGINITGNAATASSIAWTGVSGKPTNFVYNDTGTWNINITGNAGSATGTGNLNNRGRVTAELSGTTEPRSVLTLREVYANGYPTPYGNVITLGGAGGGELLVGWSGSTGAHADNYVRSRRDVGGDIWSAWARLITDVNYNEYAPSKTGGGASGTWGINITGNAGTVSTLTRSQVVSALGYTPASTTINSPANNFGDDIYITKSQPTIFFNDTGDAGIEIAIRVNSSEGLVIYEPEDGNSEWLRIDDNSGAGYLWGKQIETRGDMTFTSGNTQYANNYTNQVGSFNNSLNFLDVFPPAGYGMGNLSAFIPSIAMIHFAGGVNGDDSMRCVYAYLSDRIRVWVQNTEQRSTPAANWLAIWRKN